MAFDRLVWYITPEHQRTSQNLWISPLRITVMTVIFEFLTLVFMVTGVLLLIFPVKGSYYGYDSFDRAYALLITSLVLQLLCRGYLTASSLKTASSSKAWMIKEGALRWGSDTVLNVVNLSGFLLTVRLS